MRGVVAAHATEDTVHQALTDCRLMVTVSNRRVHLRKAAVLFVAVRCRQEEVVRGRLGGDELAEVALAQQRDFIGGRHVQEVHLAARLLDEVQQAARRTTRSFLMKIR